MSFLSKWFNLNEERVVKDSPKEEDRIVVEEITQGMTEAYLKDVTEFLDSLRKKSKTKRDLYAIYDKMSEDSLISGALEILSDDIAMKDNIRGKSVWAEKSDNAGNNAERIVDKVNTFLEAIKIEKKVWGYGWNLLIYGEVFLRTYDKEFQEHEVPDDFTQNYGATFEKVEEPADIVALEQYDTGVGFGVVKRDDNNMVTQGYTLVGSKEYIHIVCDRKLLREKVTLSYEKDGKDKKDEFKVVIGSSYLEAARQAWTIIDLIESLILYVRYARSDIYNIVSVEVGSAGRAETSRILRTVKRMFNTQDSMDMKSKTYTGTKKPIPHGENIYVAVKQGKGDIKVDPVGGNFDIKELVDLEYWLTKLVAALKQPKAYLGIDDGNLIGLNNQSLTRQDIRYCRTVVAYHECLLDGIKDMCDYYLTCTGDEENIDEYVIRGAKIMSAEASDRVDDIQSKIELSTAIKEFVSDVDGADVSKAVRIIIDKILDLSSLDPGFSEVFGEVSE